MANNARYQAYWPGVSVFARGPLGLWVSTEWRADIAGNVARPCVNLFIKCLSAGFNVVAM